MEQGEQGGQWGIAGNELGRPSDIRMQDISSSTRSGGGGGRSRIEGERDEQGQVSKKRKVTTVPPFAKYDPPSPDASPRLGHRSHNHHTGGTSTQQDPTETLSLTTTQTQTSSHTTENFDPNDPSKPQWWTFAKHGKYKAFSGLQNAWQGTVLANKEARDQSEHFGRDYFSSKVGGGGSGSGSTSVMNVMGGGGMGTTQMGMNRRTSSLGTHGNGNGLFTNGETITEEPGEMNGYFPSGIVSPETNSSGVGLGPGHNQDGMTTPGPGFMSGGAFGGPGGPGPGTTNTRRARFKALGLPGSRRTSQDSNMMKHGGMGKISRSGSASTGVGVGVGGTNEEMVRSNSFGGAGGGPGGMNSFVSGGTLGLIPASPRSITSMTGLQPETSTSPQDSHHQQLRPVSGTIPFTSPSSRPHSHLPSSPSNTTSPSSPTQSHKPNFRQQPGPFHIALPSPAFGLGRGMNSVMVPVPPTRALAPPTPMGWDLPWRPSYIGTQGGGGAYGGGRGGTPSSTGKQQQAPPSPWSRAAMWAPIEEEDQDGEETERSGSTTVVGTKEGGKTNNKNNRSRSSSMKQQGRFFWNRGKTTSTGNRKTGGRPTLTKSQRLKHFLIFDARSALYLRIIIIACLAATLGLGVSIRAKDNGSDGGGMNVVRGIVGSSPILAIIYAPPTLLHAILAMHREAFGRPIGLWGLRSKMLWVCLDLFFIALWSSELSLAISDYMNTPLLCTPQAAWWNNLPTSSIQLPTDLLDRKKALCDREAGLIAFVLAVSICYVANMVLQLFRIFERIQTIAKAYEAARSREAGFHA